MTSPSATKTTNGRSRPFRTPTGKRFWKRPARACCAHWSARTTPAAPPHRPLRMHREGRRRHCPESRQANVTDRGQTIMRVTELTLASLPDAPSCGRLLVQRYLSAWGIAHIIDEAQLVMSELLTNAVKASAEFTTIQIRLAVLGDTSLLIEVQDCNPEPPILNNASGDNES